MTMSRPASLQRAIFSVGAVLALALSGCGSGRVAKAPGSAPASAPDFELKDVDGKAFRLSEAKGTVRLVDFWATWCAPCREEIPMFKDLHATYGSKGFTLVGIAMDDEGVAKVKPFVDENKIPYLTLIGNDDVAQSFGGIVGFPSKFLVDRDGKIVETWVGEVPRSVLEKRIQSLL
jgi:peroxiredoxin